MACVNAMHGVDQEISRLLKDRLTSPAVHSLPSISSHNKRFVTRAIMLRNFRVFQ